MENMTYKRLNFVKPLMIITLVLTREIMSVSILYYVLDVFVTHNNYYYYAPTDNILRTTLFCNSRIVYKN